jgi:hypothetical protein
VWAPTTTSIPTYNQGKKILWKGIDKDGFRFLDHFPKELVFSVNETEMSVTLRHPTDFSKPGSIFQIIGTDNIDSIVGTNPIGCVFSEYSLQDPAAWDYLSAQYWQRMADGQSLTTLLEAKITVGSYLKWLVETPRDGFHRS